MDLTKAETTSQRPALDMDQMDVEPLLLLLNKSWKMSRPQMLPHGIPDWAREGEFRTTGAPFRTKDGEAQLVAVRQGLGITTLPCFVGDAAPLLARVPGINLHLNGTLWLLTQGETRKTKRVQLFTDFLPRRFGVHVPLLAGLSISRD